MVDFINMLDMAIILTTSVFSLMCAYYIFINNVFNYTILGLSFIVLGVIKFIKWFDRKGGDFANINDLIEDLTVCFIVFGLIIFYKVLLEKNK